MPKPVIHRIRTRRLPAIWLAASVVAATLAPAQNAMAQRGNESMFVSVLDAAGTPVSGLSVTDFVVEEDGAEREVLDVRPAVTPMQIAILVDTSASVADAARATSHGRSVQPGTPIPPIGYAVHSAIGRWMTFM